MKKTNLLYLFLFICLLTNPLLATQYRRLLIFLDHNKSEHKLATQSMSAVTQKLATGIHQKASPIIVTSSLFEHFLSKKYDRDNYSLWFGSVIFHLNDWEIFNIPTANLIVLLPKKNGHLYDDSEQILLPMTRQSVTIKLFNKEHWIKYEPTQNKIQDWGKTLLNISKKSDFINNTPSSIKLLRHSLFTSSKKLHDNIVEDLTNIFTSNKEIKTNTTISNAMQNNPDLKTINFLHAYTKPWNIYMLGHGQVDLAIAGVPIDKLPPILNLFNELNVYLLRLSSCFLGGKNLKYLYAKKSFEQGPSQNLRFITIVDSISDSSVIIISHKKQIQITPHNDLNHFFDLIEAAKPNQPQLSKNDTWLTNILQYLSLDKDWYYFFYGLNGFPQVLIPRVGWFTTFNVNPDILLLNKTFITKHILEKKSVTIQNKLAVLFTENKIPVKLVVSPSQTLKPSTTLMPRWITLLEHFPTQKDFNLKPNYVSSYFLPQFISANHLSSTHYIETLHCNNYGFLQSIRDLFFKLNGRSTLVMFFIKKLEAINDIHAILKKTFTTAGKAFDQHKYSVFMHNKNAMSDFSNILVAKMHTSMSLLFKFKETYWMIHCNYQLEQKLYDEPWDFSKSLWSALEPITKERYESIKKNIEDIKKKSVDENKPNIQVERKNNVPQLQATLKLLKKEIVQLSIRLKKLIVTN